VPHHPFLFKGKTNASSRSSNDPTILKNLTVHQDRAKSRIRERGRERDQTHSYWYIPSAPRVNYSLLIMEIAGMMKMVSGDDFPLRQGARIGLQMGSLWWIAAAESKF